MKNIQKFSAIIVSLAFFIGSLSLNVAPALADSSTAPNSAINPTTSYNWSGYVAGSGSYTSVTGTWTVPKVSGNAFSADATWVGIGGVSSQDLIQAGTQAIIDGSGQITYQAWYELLPQVSTPISMAVNAGDSITASINETYSGSNQWNINIHDNTNGQTYSTNASYTSSLSSAEWIEEMPSQGSGQFIPLDNFGTVNFSSAAATYNGQQLNLNQISATAMTMLNGSGQALATTSAINSDGASFSVSRTSTPSTAAVSPISGFGRGWRRGGRGLNGYSGGSRGQNPNVTYVTIPGSTASTTTTGIQNPFAQFRRQLRQLSQMYQLRITYSFSR